MSRLSCDLIQDLLPLYHDGVTTDATARAVSEHLKTCPACQAELDALTTPLPPTSTSSEEDPKALFRKTIKTWRRRYDGYFLVIFLLIAALFCLGGYFLLHGEVIPFTKDQIRETRVYPYEDADGNRKIFLLYALPTYTGSSRLNPQLSLLGSQRVMEYRPTHTLLAKDITDEEGWSVHCAVITESDVDQIKVCGKTVWTAGDPPPAAIPAYVYAGDAHLTLSQRASSVPSTPLTPLTRWVRTFNYLGFQDPDGHLTLWDLDGSLLYDGTPTPEELFLHYVHRLPYSEP